MSNSGTEEQLEMDFFFWLGDAGETEPVSEAEFNVRQSMYRQNLDDFLNVRIR